MKKFLAYGLILSLSVFLGLNSISADELDNNEIVDSNVKVEVLSKCVPAPDEFFTNPSDELIANPFSTSGTRSLNIPTSYWNLSSSTYYGNIIELASSWLYTNYYFHPNSNGRLFLDYNVSLMNSWSTKMKIGVYNITDGTWEQIFNVTQIPTGACLMITGLYTTDNYAIAFKTYDQANINARIHGTFTISH